ncbi:sensor domain-containing diguanylate cyclase [Cognatilysobacter lacus]|uniref:GGDEF domain-containing protein n=1 Tax=Cognatilysobacter lacus TaxID=1643323 RepID=A0A5D8Z7K5_9GAMM|nr:sensor domain-containing diguanylate cyclase [Lysobacter lacus]TZF90878.1 GGDEF domain-containing protein [Lysobacter lacus]
MRADGSDIESAEHIKAERDRLLEIVAALGAVSSSAGTTPALMRETVNQVMQLTRAQGSVVELVDGDELDYQTASGTVAGYVGLRLKAATSLSGLCVARKQVIYCDDTETDPRVDAPACRKIGARSMLVVPLLRGGDAIGVLKSVSRFPAAFDRIDAYALSLFAQFIGGVIARQAETDSSHELAADMSRRALRDELTGLPNRAAWNEELERGIARARRARAPLAVMFLDLDGFKAVNDSYGHAAGDHVLAMFAEQVRGCVRASDFVARLAGDEFAVMVEGIDNVERDAPVVADKIIEAARAGTPWRDTTLHCMPSVGVAYQVGPDYDAATLMRFADDAMYRAKNARTLFTVSDCSGSARR